MEAREVRRPPIQARSNSDSLQFNRIALAAALIDYEEDSNDASNQPSSRAISSAVLSPYRTLLSPPDARPIGPYCSETSPPPAPQSLSSVSETRLRSLYGGSDNGLGSERSSQIVKEGQGSRSSQVSSSYSMQATTGLESRRGSFQSNYRDTIFSEFQGPLKDEENSEEVLILEKRSNQPKKLRRKSLPPLSRPIMIPPRPKSVDIIPLASSRPRAKSFEASRSLSLSLLPPLELEQDSLSSAIRNPPSLNNLSPGTRSSLPSLLPPTRRLSTSISDYLSFPTLRDEDILPEINPSGLSSSITDFLSTPLSIDGSTTAIDPTRSTSPLEPLLQSPTISSFSPSPRFTSRFDPSMLDLARQEMEGDRVVFSNKEAGSAPRNVIMPTPLSGQPQIPMKKVRVEGPEQDDEPEVEEEAIESGTGEKDQMAETKRPAGRLYGTSLLNMLDERKITNKSKQKQYVPGNDGRRTMMDWKSKEVIIGEVVGGPETVTTQEVADEGVAGGRFMPRAKSTMSIFGPDLLYQRDLERRRVVEEQEMKQLEQEDLEEAEVWRKGMIKEEAKSRKLQKKQNIKNAESKLEGRAVPVVTEGQ